MVIAVAVVSVVVAVVAVEEAVNSNGSSNGSSGSDCISFFFVCVFFRHANTFHVV